MRPLSSAEAEILVLLRNLRISGSGRALTAVEIQQELDKQKTPPAFATTRKALHRLATETLLDKTETPRRDGLAGPTPIGFRVRWNAVLTSSVTARLVLDLYNSPEFNPHRAHFLAKFGSQHPDIPHDTVERSLDYAITAGYVAQGQDSQLTPTRRVDEDLVYLERLRDCDQNKTRHDQSITLEPPA